MPAPAGTANPVTVVSKALGLIALLALAWMGYEAFTLRQEGLPLATPSAPRRLISLQLAPTAADAQQILTEWGCGTTPQQMPCSAAADALQRDSWFVLSYVLAFALVAVWAHVAGGVSKKVVGLIILSLVAGGLEDLAENWLLGLALGNAEALPFARLAPLVPGLVEHLIVNGAPLPDRLFALARLAAMSKFVLLLVGVAGTLAIAGGALRLYVGATRTARARDDDGIPTISSFGDLVEHETRGIFDSQPGRPRDYPVCEIHEAADEEYVAFREADLIGLAMSGGGIRSATFNLGLLQGMHRVGLLRLFDYVSTVSGGGYVGSFWSAWLARSEETPGTPGWDTHLFPTPSAEHGGSRVESDPERHLREFGGFLAPRWGFFEVETWTAVVALLAGLVPALLIGLAAIGVTLIVWLSLTFPLASRRPELATALAVGVISSVVLVLFERMWQQFKRESAGWSSAPTDAEKQAAARGRAWYRGFAAATVILLAALQGWLTWDHVSSAEHAWPIYRYGLALDVSTAPEASGLVRWWALTGIDNPGRPWIVSPRLFDFGLTWLLGGVVLILVRTLSAVAPVPWRHETLAAFDRVLMRVLGMGAAWMGLTALWHLVINLETLLSAAIAAAVTGGIFAALRNWIGVTLRRPSEAGLQDRLKPVLPSLLAYLTLVLTAVTVGALLVRVAGTDWYLWFDASVVMTLLLVVALFISPDEFGLHAFYRDRISRAYAGASNLAARQRAADNRSSEPREKDDLLFTALRPRPLHLVCCAANDLSGDQVETLGRGSRSAVLSKHGFSLGRYARAWEPYSPGNRLGSGVTASAAAFNSNMGHISVRVGPAVSFLMTMLNLRLGLWVRHPLARRAGFRRWPGLLYYREMLGLTSASGRIHPMDVPKSVLRDIHLSDGGHFENLAFYELIRRHCRYILLSDCGADPDVAFDDLGNALRRVREDFGVDVELDVSPLRPGVDRLSRQHLAVGTIHYPTGDTGILLYVKPAVTGDEPPDVQQYRTRNAAFPHEATTDQFYDETQWESYRRLGLHAAEQIFQFVARADDTARWTADRVFAEASQRWGVTPEGLEDRVLEMTKRWGELDAELQQRRAHGLLHDVFPEAGFLPEELRSTPAAARGERGHADPVTDAGGVIAAEISVLLRVTQLMEDVWVACELDRWWLHPLNLGWINLFARWATSPSFRFWWPLMAPMFGPGFRRFIQHRYPVRTPGTNDLAQPQKGHVLPIDDPRGSGLAALWWEQRSVQPLPWSRPVPPECSRTFHQNIIMLPRTGGDVPIQAGLAAVTRHGTSVGWTSDDFFVPPSLWGAGIGWFFLDGLLDAVSADGPLCHVVVKAPPPGQAHQVARDDRRAFVEQYRKIGFRQVRPTDERSSAVDMALCQALGYDPDRDTLLTLHLGPRQRG